MAKEARELWTVSLFLVVLVLFSVLFVCCVLLLCIYIVRGEIKRRHESQGSADCLCCLCRIGTVINTNTNNSIRYMFLLIIFGDFAN